MGSSRRHVFASGTTIFGRAIICLLFCAVDVNERFRRGLGNAIEYNGGGGRGRGHSIQVGTRYHAAAAGNDAPYSDSPRKHYAYFGTNGPPSQWGFYSGSQHALYHSAGSEHEDVSSEEEKAEEERPALSDYLPGLVKGVKYLARSVSTVYDILQTFPTLKEEDGDGSDEEGGWSLPLFKLDELRRQQCRIHRAFPCDVRIRGASYFRTDSADKLRPGDISVVGALGDFAVAGTGALSTKIPDSGREFRGVSFATGGDGSWRRVLTLANILRLFNPDLLGVSTGYGRSTSRAAGFNLAETSATSADLLPQAVKLADRIRSAASVNPEKDWKLITILMGQNDICRLSCKENATEAFVSNVREALDYLQENLPSTLVNLVQPFDPAFYLEAFHRPVGCRLASRIACPCLEGPEAAGRTVTEKAVEEFREGLRKLVDQGRYERKGHFRVVLQPALEGIALPEATADEDIDVPPFGRSFKDLSYLAPNCIYPSQKLQALMAKAVWNNLVEHFDFKSSWEPDARLQCPIERNGDAYLSTFTNSRYPEGTEAKTPTKPFAKVRKRRRRRLGERRGRTKRGDYNKKNGCNLV